MFNINPMFNIMGGAFNIMGRNFVMLVTFHCLLLCIAQYLNFLQINFNIFLTYFLRMVLI